MHNLTTNIGFLLSNNQFTKDVLTKDTIKQSDGAQSGVSQHISQPLKSHEKSVATEVNKDGENDSDTDSDDHMYSTMASKNQVTLESFS